MKHQAALFRNHYLTTSFKITILICFRSYLEAIRKVYHLSKTLFSGQIGLWSQQNVLAIEPKTVYGSVTQLAPHFIFMQLHHWLSTWYVRCPQSRLEIDWYWWEFPLGDRVIANDAALYIHWSNSPPTIRFSATKKCCNFLSRVFLAKKKKEPSSTIQRAFNIYCFISFYYYAFECKTYHCGIILQFLI